MRNQNTFTDTNLLKFLRKFVQKVRVKTRVILQKKKKTKK